ncbi:MAG: phosphogluconate dehydratase [Pseudohongiellaceae bacterium]
MAQDIPLNPVVKEVTEKIRRRSRAGRAAYLARIDKQAEAGPARSALSCGNLAHGMAACSQDDKGRLADETVPNIAIVTAYNDMLSAHQPYADYPLQIKAAAAQCGAVAQVAGGVPAMCDGVTQGREGMELSLFSRDVIALGTAVALSHNMFDAAMYLGICDKIVPGLLIGALSFGHLPGVFVPAGPMPSGLPNREKAKTREAFAAGKADRSELLAVESAAYHSAGTCTFYGTANSNQMLMEIMGLQLPGSSFVNPGDALRPPLTAAAVKQALANVHSGEHYTPLGKVLSEATIVNGIVGLLATGGSTNHTMHLIAIAATAGITIDWSDMAALSRTVPLLTQVYPNGSADVNQFHQAGGLAVVICELLNAGLLHEDVLTVVGPGLRRYTELPQLQAAGNDSDNRLSWVAGPGTSGDRSIIREVADPFDKEGGIRLLEGNVGRAIVKVSAVQAEHRQITANAKVFHSQQQFMDAFAADELNEDMVAVLCGQGPKANGMPELHKLTPLLGVLQNKGLKVALLTDGRMSGASGKVLAAIQVTPEAGDGGAIGQIRDGDAITIDADAGTIEVAAKLSTRDRFQLNDAPTTGMGRELFEMFRKQTSAAEAGASVLFAKNRE